MKLGTILPLSVLMLTTGCASILNENTQKINVGTSNNEKATVSIDGKSFEVPGVVEVKRQNQDKILVSESENCAKQTMLAKSVDEKFFINILSGGAFGSTTDFASEKMWKYQEAVTVNCK